MSTLSQLADLLLMHGANVTDDSLVRAVLRHDVPLVKTLLAHGGNPEAVGTEGRSLLTLACKFGDTDTVNALLTAGASLDAKDVHGLRPIDWAIHSGDQQTVEALVREGAEIPTSSLMAFGGGADRFPGQKPSVSPRSAKEGGVPYLDRLIHITLSGDRVRSKSEVIVADTLYHLGIAFRYELPLMGRVTGGMKLPDFTIPNEHGGAVIWEHLGMLSNRQYAEQWELKLAWYSANGFLLGRDLFVSCDDADGGLDSRAVMATAERIRHLVHSL